MKTFARFFLLLLAFGLLPVGGVLLEFSQSNAVVRDNARVFHSQLARLAAESTEDAFAEMNRALGFVVELDEGRLSRSEEAALLQGAVSSNGRLLLAALYAVDGRRALHLADERAFPGDSTARGVGRLPTESGGGTSSREGSVDEAAWAALSSKALSSGKVALGAVRTAGDSPYVPIAYPLSDGRLLRAAYGLEALKRRLAGLRAGTGGRVVLVDAAGTPLPSFEAPDLLSDAATLPGVGDEATGWHESLPGGGERLVGAWAVAGSSGWIAWSLQPRAEAFAVGERAGEKALAVFGFLLLVVSGAALWLSRRIASPLAALVDGARRSAEGRFDTTLPEAGWSEFRSVTRAFNVMMRSLEKYRLLQVDEQLEQKAKLEALVRAVPSGIVLADPDGKIRYVNAAARDILNLAALTAPGGLGASEAVSDPQLLKALSAALKDGTHPPPEELAREIGGKRRVFLVLARSVRRGKSLLGALLVISDVTAERQLEALRERFLHAIVHDLRAPITAISGWIEVMEMRGFITPDGRKGSAFIRSAVSNMTELVENILDSAKLKAGGIRPERKVVAAAELLEEVRRMFAMRADILGLTLRVEAAPGVVAFCDRRLIARALGNLVGNALKYTPRGGLVVLCAGGSNVGAEFSVADTGHGIPEEKLDDIFRPFEQASAADQNTGFGLGLSLVKDWVELHGGHIRVESELEKGTRFIFTIPAAPVATRAAGALICLLACVPLAHAALSGGPFELSAPLKDAGGGSETAGGELFVQGSLGQSALPEDRPRGGDFELRRGFFDPPKLRLQKGLAYEIRGPGGALLSLPAGSVDRPTFDLAFRRDPVAAPLNADPSVIASANAKMRQNRGPLAYAVGTDVWDVSLHDEAGFLDGDLLASGSLSLPYRDADGDGIVDGTNPPVRVDTLDLWRLDEQSALWVRVPNAQINAGQSHLTMSLAHLSVFALIGGADTEVSKVYAFPVPFRPNGPNAGTGPGQTGSDAAGITFTNLPTEGFIEIYTLDGRLVRRLEIPANLMPAKMSWDAGVASGVYVWRVVSDENAKIGRLMVIR